MRRSCYILLSKLLNLILFFLPFNCLRVLLLRVAGVNIGKRTWISSGVRVDFPWRLTIGNNCYISRAAYLDCRGGTIRIGDNTDISVGALIFTLSHDIYSIDFKVKQSDVVVGNRVWIGARSIVLPGAEISDGTVIGALTCCSVVTRKNALYSGVPAQFIKELPADRSSKVRQGVGDVFE